MKKFLVSLLTVLMLSVLVTGCFGFPFKAAISANETGVIMKDGVTISSVVHSGRYRDMGMHSKLTQLDNSTHLYQWVGTDLWTKDKQPLDFIINVQYHRTSDAEVIKRLWGTYSNVFRRDDAMERMVASRIPEVAKNMTTQDTLEGILGIAEGSGGRAGSQAFMFKELSREFLEFGVVVDNVSIDTITASDEYVQKLNEKAAAQLQVELAKQNTLKLKEELIQEQAQTDIELEKARRDNLVNEELAKVYEQSDEFLEIRKLEIWGDILGDKATMWFVDPKLDLTLLLNQDGSVIPLQ